jgi:flagellar biosynthetic protein FliR
MLVSDMHHQLLASIVDSYDLYPASGILPPTNQISEAIGKTVTMAFKIGVQIAIPFLVVGTLMQIGFGVLGRLLPQIQVFFLALPLQIFLSLLTLLMVLTSSILFWLQGYESVLIHSITPK